MTPSSFETLFQLLVGSFTQQSITLLATPRAASTDPEDFNSVSPLSPTLSSAAHLETLLRLVAASLKVRPDLGEKNPSLFVEAFVFGYLLPKCLSDSVNGNAQRIAKNIWVAWTSVKGGDGEVVEALKERLKGALGDVNIQARCVTFFPWRKKKKLSTLTNWM